MAVVGGFKGVFKLDNSSSALTDLTSYTREVNFQPDQAMGDTTVFGATAHSKIPLLKDSKMTVQFVNDPTLQTHLLNLYVNQASTSWNYEYGPQGSTVGSRKITGTVWLMGAPIVAQVDQVELISANFEGTGSITVATY